jgi:hypothetical protein
MKLIGKYLDIAIKFERLAAQETPSKLRTSFEKQAAAYRKLAAKRARKLGVPEPPSQTGQVALYLADLNRAAAQAEGQGVASLAQSFFRSD